MGFVGGLRPNQIFEAELTPRHEFYPAVLSWDFQTYGIKNRNKKSSKTNKGNSFVHKHLRWADLACAIIYVRLALLQVVLLNNLTSTLNMR